MKKIFTLLTMVILSAGLTMAQSLPLDFESDYGSNLTFNDGITGEVTADPAGGNQGQVLKSVLSSSGSQWQNIKIKLTDNYIDLTGNDKVVTFKAYSTVSVGGIIKLESSLGGEADVEIGFTTAGSGWESFSLDFANAWSNNAVVSANDEYLHVVYLPGYNGAGGDNTIVDGVEIYFDDLTGPVGTAVVADPQPTTKAPVPAHLQANVNSIFSDEYTPPTNVNYNPGWWQSTEYSTIEVDGDLIMKYKNLNYQGITFDAINVSGADYLHFDYWTPDGTDLRASPISDSSGEAAYLITSTTQGQWVSVDVPLTHYTNELSTLSFVDIDEFKFDTEATQGNYSLGIFYIDNVYFYSGTPTAIGEVVTPSLNLYPNPVSDILNIKGLDEGTVVEIYGATGTLAKKVQVANGTVNVADLPRGVYFVSANGATSKIIKK